MRIETRARGSVQVLDVSASGSGVWHEGLLREHTGRLVEAGESLLVLNLVKGPALDSATLGELVACRERVRKHDGAMKLVLTHGQQELLVESGLSELFGIFRDEDEALDSFLSRDATAGIP